MTSLRNFSAMTLATLGLVALMPLGGCVVTSEEQPTTKQYTYPNQSDFCAAVARAECSDKVVGNCYGSDSTSLASDKQKCVGVRSDLSLCNPDNLSYHPEAADPCVAKYKAVYDDGTITSDEVDAIDEACLAVFSKGGLAGSNCSTDTDCDTGAGLRCVQKAGSGKCEKPTIVGGGLKCDQPEQACDKGFYCDGTHCIAQPEGGEACAADIPCADGFQCSTADTGDSCVAKLENGSTCESADQCKGGFCIAADGKTSGTCTSSDKLELTSASCAAFRPAM